MATAYHRMLETILLQVDQSLLPADAMERLGYNRSPVVADPAFACLGPELRKQTGPSVREFIEDSTLTSQRFACHVSLQALRDKTILGTGGD